MNSKILYTSAALLMGASFVLTSCQNEEFVSMQGQEVLLTVTANRGDVDTRTTFEENGADLICKWSKGDQLIVANASGAKIGAISLVGDGGEATGQFQGLVSLNAGEEINLIYLGNGVEISGVENDATSFSVNYSAQDGTFTSMAAHDILGGTATVSAGASNGTVTADVVMARKVDLAYFRLNLDDDVTLAANDVVTITGGEALYTSANVSFAKGGSIGKATNAANTLTITKAEAGNDIYFTMLPCTSVTPTLTVNKGGYKYTKTLDANSWTGGSYVHAGTVSNGKADPYLVSTWDKEKEPVDVGNLDNWGGNKKSAKGTPFTPIFYSKYGYTLNIGNSGDYLGGFCRALEITNGITSSGLLTSQSDNETYINYYQWGRNIGFPGNIRNTNKQPIGVNSCNSGVAYRDGDVVTLDFIWGQYSKEKSQDYSICFIGMSSGTYDYCSENSLTTWEERAGGNPCPDNYRIPTAKELEVFVPNKINENKFTSSHAEIKEINGKRYAMSWTAHPKSGNTYAYLEIKSVETTKSIGESITASDAIFGGSDVKSIVLWAYGYLFSTATYTQGYYEYAGASELGTSALYWSSSSGNMYEDMGVNANGGRCLSIDISSNGVVEICMLNVPTSFAMPVIPIYDPTAKGSSMKPVLPYKNDRRNLSGYYHES